ncbi:MAG: DUF3784 domain-containing protein [Methanomassiliicoccaceae archaeon]|jgi:hypothetical protein|nr:DUF3784 domain-containing protein [Methanomassiliicoccaceae archaeon]
MADGNRKREALFMLILWCTVPLVALLYDLPSVGTELLLWFSVVYSGIFFFCGLPIFMGHVHLLSGFNMMSPKERSRYDIDKVCRFTGLSMFVISMATFYTALLSLIAGNEALLLWAIILLPVAGAIAIVIVLNGKRFKRDPAWPDANTAEDAGGRRYAKLVIAAVLIISAVAVIGVVLLSISGNVSASIDDDGLQVSAPMMSRSIDHADIVSVEFRESFDIGTRTNGFGGMNISSGTFRNAEFGSYDLAVNNGVDAFIVVTPSSGKVLVFNSGSVERTLDLYDELSGRL